MNIQYSHFWVSKEGDRAILYEDAFFPYNFPFDVILQDSFKRFALADGASTAYLSGMWATILVDGFGSYEGEITTSNFFDLLQTRILDENWNPRLIDYIKKREDDGKPLSWYDEMALQNGAASTFLEISFPFEGKELGENFSAHAIGDSCLFQVRNDILITNFPLNSSADFDNSPLLISSDPKKNENLYEKIASLENGNTMLGDQFFLMTDALASWFFQEHEKGEKPWNIIEEKAINQSCFIDWIENLRENKQIRNDDVTLLILKVEGG